MTIDAIRIEGEVILYHRHHEARCFGEPASRWIPDWRRNASGNARSCRVWDDNDCRHPRIDAWKRKPRGVRVDAVAPTYIETELNAYVYNDPEIYRHWVGGTPMNRRGCVDEVGSVVLFLASEASSLMTGSIVLADGGYTCW